MNYKTVTIPAMNEHMGIHETNVTLLWVCPTCGGPRGEVYKGRSYDGSRSMTVDCWENPCGHLDIYAACRAEAKQAEIEAK